jgi:hypothetical protein
MASLVFMIVLGTSIWVLIDAKSLGFGQRQLYRGGRADEGPWFWFFGCLLLWIVVFPWYLVKRGRYRSSTEPVSEIAPDLARLSDSITQIERLSELKEKGVISEDEFLTKRKCYLGE